MRLAVCVRRTDGGARALESKKKQNEKKKKYPVFGYNDRLPVSFSAYSFYIIMLYTITTIRFIILFRLLFFLFLFRHRSYIIFSFHRRRS